MDYEVSLAVVCKHLEIEPEQILACTVRRSEVHVVVDYGIKGGKKFYIPLGELVAVEPDPEQEPELEPEALETPPSVLGDPALKEPEASDAAVALAAEQGLGLALVPGTGSGGRIVKQDVVDYLAIRESLEVITDHMQGGLTT